MKILITGGTNGMGKGDLKYYCPVDVSPGAVHDMMQAHSDWLDRESKADGRSLLPDGR